MFQLRVKVTHRLGIFKGVLAMQKEDATHENMKDALEVIQLGANSLDRLVLVQDDGAELVFNQKILRNAILSLKIEEAVE